MLESRHWGALKRHPVPPFEDAPLSLRYTSPDFLYIRSWLPCIFFAGVITMGNIGRQLALVRGGSEHLLMRSE